MINKLSQGSECMVTEQHEQQNQVEKPYGGGGGRDGVVMQGEVEVYNEFVSSEDSKAKGE